VRLENGQSYEAYVRPLTLPWGYTLARGSRHEPAISLSFSGRADPSEGGVQSEATIRLCADLGPGCQT